MYSDCSHRLPRLSTHARQAFVGAAKAGGSLRFAYDSREWPVSPHAFRVCPGRQILMPLAPARRAHVSKIARETNTAVNMDARIPNVSVTAKPRTGPVPN